MPGRAWATGFLLRNGSDPLLASWSGQRCMRRHMSHGFGNWLECTKLRLAGFRPFDICCTGWGRQKNMCCCKRLEDLAAVFSTSTSMLMHTKYQKAFTGLPHSLESTPRILVSSSGSKNNFETFLYMFFSINIYIYILYFVCTQGRFTRS